MLIPVTKIDKGIPIPPIVRPKPFPYDEMEVGDSFKLSHPNDGASAKRWAEKCGVEITQRGDRIWRTK